MVTTTIYTTWMLPITNLSLKAQEFLSNCIVKELKCSGNLCKRLTENMGLLVHNDIISAYFGAVTCCFPGYMFAMSTRNWLWLNLLIWGTSLTALLGYAKEPASCAQVVLVIANRSGVEELKNATLAGIPTRVRRTLHYNFMAKNPTLPESIFTYNISLQSTTPCLIFR